MTPALLRAEDLSARRGGRLVLLPCDLLLGAGERVAIYGPNGAGKSTMLQALAGLLPITSGRISFQDKTLGREVSLLEYHRRTAAMFQEPLLLRGTVRHNVELGLKLRGVATAEREARVRNLLEHLRISHLADRSVASLSGGEAQRTSLARALVLDPELLFLDEPFAALDAPTRDRLADEFCRILDERRIATLFVTHDIDEAARLCDRCVVLEAGSVLQQDDMIAVLERPASRRVAEIIGASNVFEGRVAEVGSGGMWVDWNGHRIFASAQVKVGARIEFLIRQEQVCLHAKQTGTINQVSGRVDHVRRRGGSQIVSVGVGNPKRLWVQCSTVSERLMPGEAVAISFPPDAVWIFPEQAENSMPAPGGGASGGKSHVGHPTERAVSTG